MYGNFNIPILVLNLDRDVNKLNETKKRLAKHHLSFARFPAVNADAIKFDDSTVTALCGAMCTNVMIAIFLSHRKMWQHIVDNNIEKAIIFEDDINILVDDFQSTFHNIWKETPNDVDILLLGCFICRHANNDFFSKMLMATVGFDRDEISVNDKIFKPKHFGGTHAYLVTYKGARKLLDVFKKATFHVDYVIARNPSIIVYASKEDIVTQDLSGKVSSNTSLDSYLLSVDFPVDHGKVSSLFMLNMPLFQIGGIKVTSNILIHLIVIILVIIVWKKYFNDI